MPAKSEDQRQLFGLALSVKRGDTPRSDVGKNVLDIVDNMSEKELSKMASKKESKLSELVKDLKEGFTDEKPKLSPEQKRDVAKVISEYSKFGKLLYREHNLLESFKTISDISEAASDVILSETEDYFDVMTVKKDIKSIQESVKVFEKTIKEANQLQQRMEAAYEDIGSKLNRYFEINEALKEIEENEKD